jgi:hypothetical protein
MTDERTRPIGDPNAISFESDDEILLDHQIRRQSQGSGQGGSPGRPLRRGGGEIFEGDVALPASQGGLNNGEAYRNAVSSPSRGDVR